MSSRRSPASRYVATSSTRTKSRWINPAAERLLSDVRGQAPASVVGPEDHGRGRAGSSPGKCSGTTAATESSRVFVPSDGTRVALEVSAVPLMGGEHVVGVFGLLTGSLDEQASTPARAPDASPGRGATARQGRSTKQIAQELHLSTETVRNHVRHLLRALGVNSRLEAVAAARQVRASKQSRAPTTSASHLVEQVSRVVDCHNG